MNTIPKDLSQFSALVEIISTLRGPEGCPWDKKQTLKSLTKYTLEEAYELIEAVEEGNPQSIKEELGDVLLQVVLNSQIASEDKQFDISQVIECLNQKLVRRHPHVFSDVSVGSSSEVEANWEEIKKQEKKDADKIESETLNLNNHQPAMLVSTQIGRESRKWNFDWENAGGVLEKVHEELQELTDAMKSQKPQAIENELGDLLFSVVQLSRHLKTDPETALRRCNRRFLQRFELMLKFIEESGEDIDTMSLETKEKFWTKAKMKLKEAAPDSALDDAGN